MKFLYIGILVFTIPVLAEFKPIQEQLPNQKEGSSTINVSFNMGNTQEAPTSNAATASSTQKVQIEHLHKSEPLPQESAFSRVKNGLVNGASGALGSIAIWKIAEHSGEIIDFLRKIFLRV